MKKLLIVIIFFMTISTGVSAEQDKLRTSITEIQAIEIAKQFYIDHEICSADWFGEDSSWATFDGEQWHVFFLPKAEPGKSVTLGFRLSIFLTPDGTVILPPEE